MIWRAQHVNSVHLKPYILPRPQHTALEEDVCRQGMLALLGTPRGSHQHAKPTSLLIAESTEIPAHVGFYYFAVNETGRELKWQGAG